MKILFWCILSLFTMTVNAVDVLTENFDSGIPGTWSVIDNEGTGLVWTNLAGCGEAANFTGTGDVACASSDIFGGAEYDTELLTPSMDLTLFTNTMLDLTSNYQNFANADFFDIDVSIDGGTIWANEHSWNEDHGGFRAAPGEAINVNLSAYDGQADVIIRFRWYNPNAGDFDWYIQVDDVVVSGDAVVVLAPATPIPTLNTWALIFLTLLVFGVTFVTIRKRV